MNKEIVINVPSLLVLILAFCNFFYAVKLLIFHEQQIQKDMGDRLKRMRGEIK